MISGKLAPKMDLDIKYNHKRRQFTDIRVQSTEVKSCWILNIKVDRTATIGIIRN